MDGLLIGGVLVGLWIAAKLKTGRPDGELVRRVHPYRRMMSFIMPERAEATVFIDSEVAAEKLEYFLAQNPDLTMTHLLLGCVARAMEQNPRLNRFVAGRRIYQRRGIFATFSMKRKKNIAEAKVAAVKLSLDPAESLVDLAARIDKKIRINRSDQKTYADREFALLDMLPRPLLGLAVWLVRWLDDHNLLPGWWMEGDDLYTSIFIANLGSLNMNPAYHHLFNYGTCPLFLTVGRIETRPVLRDGAVTTGRVLPLRWTFDERIEDGLTARGGLDALCAMLADPAATFGDG